MARLDALPSIDVIHGLRGVLDYYLWKGLPCVRKWPVTPRRNLSPATLAAAATFGVILKAFALVGSEVKALYDDDATGQPRTGRDLYVSGALGHLHEPDMSNFLDLLTEAVALLNTIEDLSHALGSIDTDDLQVDVKSSALPALASTAAHQVTQNTALAKIDDLQDALQSAATDRLLVRGMDQLFSFASMLTDGVTDDLHDDPPFIQSNPVLAGTIWVPTAIKVVNRDRVTTGYVLGLLHNDTNRWFAGETKDIPAGQRSFWAGHVFLDPGDRIRFYPTGGILGDTCNISLHGFIMSLEP